jgi:hypothetical protein
MVKYVEGIKAKYVLYESIVCVMIGSMRFGKQVLFYIIFMNKCMSGKKTLGVLLFKSK